MQGLAERLLAAEHGREAGGAGDGDREVRDVDLLGERGPRLEVRADVEAGIARVGIEAADGATKPKPTMSNLLALTPVE